MDEIFERLRTRLSAKRENLDNWLQTRPPDKKDTLLGTQQESAVGEHIHSIDDSLGKIDTGELGICTICHTPVEAELLEVDYTASVCLEHLSGEEADQLQGELELARSVQKSLLPQEAPHLAGLETAAFSRPAQFIGGDYFDFIEFDGGSPGLLIADVAGHGVSASLQMAGLQALARAIIPISQSTVEAVSHIHRLFIHNIQFTTFVTLFIATYDVETKTLAYCNAGHNPPLLIRRLPAGGMEQHWLKPTAAAIGLIEESSFTEGMIQLQPGDLLLLYTDGVVEMVDGSNNLFGAERLVSITQQLFERPSREVVSGIREALEHFAGGKPFADDTTFMVCRVL